MQIFKWFMYFIGKDNATLRSDFTASDFTITVFTSHGVARYTTDKNKDLPNINQNVASL